MESQKIYVGDDGTGNSGLATAAMMGGGGMGMWNSPMALFALPLMYGMMGNGFGGWGGNRGQGLADVGLSNQIQNLSNQVSDNQNSTLTMGAINNVSSAVRDNGVALNAGVDTINSGICGVKTAILEQGAAINLGNCQQSNLILQQAQALGNTVQNGFTQIGFQLERNACDVKETSTANTQRLLDTLNNHWSTEAQATITQLRDELATINQTNALIAALGGTGAAAKSANA